MYQISTLQQVSWKWAVPLKSQWTNPSNNSLHWSNDHGQDKKISVWNPMTVTLLFSLLRIFFSDCLQTTSGKPKKEKRNSCSEEVDLYALWFVCASPAHKHWNTSHTLEDTSNFIWLQKFQKKSKNTLNMYRQWHHERQDSNRDQFLVKLVPKFSFSPVRCHYLWLWLQASNHVHRFIELQFPLIHFTFQFFNAVSDFLPWSCCALAVPHPTSFSSPSG